MLVASCRFQNREVKDKGLKIQNGKAHELLKDFKDVEFVHIPREENSEADALVNQAIDEAE